MQATKNSGASRLLTLYSRLRFRVLHPVAESIKRFCYHDWIKSVERRAYSAESIRLAIAGFHYKPRISVIMPVYKTPRKILDAAIRSVRRQYYEDWDLCICDDGTPDATVRQCLENWASQDARIKVTFSSRNEGISAASNRALELASGEFVGLLDHDDELSPEALYEVVKLLQEHPEADMIYSDEDRLDDKGRRVAPTFKPDWSPEYILAGMYTCHFGVYRKRRVDDLEGFRPGFDGSQDYDLVLRLSERTGAIYHIPKILYHWRMIPGSAAASGEAKPYAYVAGRKALGEHLERRQMPGEIVNGSLPGRYRVRFKDAGTDRVSILIVSTGEHSVLKRCITSIENKTAYSNYEVIIAGDQNVATDLRQHLPSRSHRIVPFEGPFNFSRRVNSAAKHSSGTHLVLLHEDAEVISDDWIASMLVFCRQKEVGVVRARLPHRDGNTQQTGVVLGLARGVAGHLLRQYPRNTWGGYDTPWSRRNYPGISGACMMVPKTVFEEIGGFDEELSDGRNDIDFCLKVREAGYRVAHTPWVGLHYDDSSSTVRERNSSELDLLEARWEKFW